MQNPSENPIRKQKLNVMGAREAKLKGGSKIGLIAVGMLSLMGGVAFLMTMKKPEIATYLFMIAILSILLFLGTQYGEKLGKTTKLTGKDKKICKDKDDRWYYEDDFIKSIFSNLEEDNKTEFGIKIRTFFLKQEAKDLIGKTPGQLFDGLKDIIPSYVTDRSAEFLKNGGEENAEEALWFFCKKFERYLKMSNFDPNKSLPKEFFLTKEKGKEEENYKSFRDFVDRTKKGTPSPIVFALLPVVGLLVGSGLGIGFVQNAGLGSAVPYAVMGIIIGFVVAVISSVALDRAEVIEQYEKIENQAELEIAPAFEMPFRFMQKGLNIPQKILELLNFNPSKTNAQKEEESKKK